MATTAPASILIPALPTDLVAQGRTLQGSESRHFISRREFELWSQSHPSVRPPSGNQPAPAPATAQQQSGEAKGYRAPQHPVSHLLQSIPPRAPSRSSRSNILSYTLDLATATRLASYTSPNGSRDLLQRAESIADSAKVDIDDEWLESEHKAQGMWKLGVSLLKSNRLEGHLPSSVERRVALARLTEELLANPSPEQALHRIDERDVQSSAEVEALVALKPLTSPDTTTLYHSMATHAATSSRSATSVAQSLIDLKFGNAVDGEASAPLPDSDLKPFGDSSSHHRESETVFAQGPSAFSSSSSEITATPHMDYRIVRGQAMRTRAKDIYATSILPSTHSTWCRRHRVPSCSVCTLLSATPRVDKRRTNIPGQGLGSAEGGGGKKRLVDLVPQFLGLSSSLLRDLRERANGTDSDDADSFLQHSTASSVEINVTASWYSILHSLLIQACLEGYLVDGWTGTTAIEVLFGVGCGVWEGRGWASRVAQSHQAESNAAKSSSGMEVEEGSDDWESDEESDSEEEEEEREREKERAKLVEAAQALFGSRDVAQADFERSMRDRIHEFLNVPNGSTLESHLLGLNAKYPLSLFEADMVDFLDCTTRLLGKPALARYDTTPAASTPGQPPATNGEPDFYALTRYFARFESRAPSPGVLERHASWEETIGLSTTAAGKRRKVD